MTGLRLLAPVLLAATRTHVECRHLVWTDFGWCSAAYPPSLPDGPCPTKKVLSLQGRVLLTLLSMLNPKPSPQLFAGAGPRPPPKVMTSPTRATSAPAWSSTVTCPSRRTTLYPLGHTRRAFPPTRHRPSWLRPRGPRKRARRPPSPGCHEEVAICGNP